MHRLPMIVTLLAALAGPLPAQGVMVGRTFVRVGAEGQPGE
jgi:hypothetical protein